MTGKLAWIRVNGRLEAQKWAADCPATYTRKNNGFNEGYDLIAMWLLTADEMREPVAALAARYPTTKPTDGTRGTGASDPIVEISVPGTLSTEVDDYGQPVIQALPDSQRRDDPGAGAYRRWEDALVAAVLSRLPRDRFSRAGEAG